MLLSIRKHSFSRIQGQLTHMNGVISGIATPKDKTKSNPLNRIKVRIFSKSEAVFSSFPMSLKEKVYTPNELPESKHGNKINRGNKSES